MKLERMHIDKCTVYRAIQEETEHGETKEKWKKLYIDIPCRLSQKVLRSPTLGDNIVSVQEYKLFTNLSADIKQNDVLQVTRHADNQIYLFRASKPFAYSVIKHKEIVLQEISNNFLEEIEI